MKAETASSHPPLRDRSEAGRFADTAPAAVPTLEPDDGVDAHRAYDDGLLAEIPFALDAYVQRHCFGFC